MKKNLLSVIILALLVANIVLTSIMMVSVMGTMKKSSKLIDGISSALALEVNESGAAGAEAESAVAMEDLVVYKIEDEMTIPLAKGDDGESHFCLVSVSLSLNSKAEDYEKYGTTIADKEDLIKGEINAVIGSHTLEEAAGNQDILREEILEKIRQMYNSDFVYNVVFREIVFQ